MNEVFLPAFLLFAGVLLNSTIPSWRSDSRLQTPDRLPLPQQLLFNQYPVISGNVDIKSLAENLPDQNSWNISYRDGAQTLFDYGNFVYDHGQQKASIPPYQYGSYQIFEANKTSQTYQFISFVNLTSQDAAGLYPQFMYESILKVATGDPNFKFKLRSTPPPLNSQDRFRLQNFKSGLITFYTAVSYSVMLTTVVSYLVVERKAGLKHLQESSGMQLKAYWIANFIVDFLKMQITIAVTIGAFKGFDMGLEDAMYVYILFPLGVIPFTYVTSFIFSVDSAAQTFTMFLHFFVLAILATIIFALRITPNDEMTGDIINYVARIIPTYPLASAVYCDSSCQKLAELRKSSTQGTGFQLNPDKWSITNLPLDLITLFAHFFIWSFVIILVEKRFFQKLFIKKKINLPIQEYELDDDVVKESERIKLKKIEEGEAIEVKEFRKVYDVQSKNPCKKQSLTAVNNLSFSLQSGECFALLGVNGAGKSTTFKSLTCEVKPTSGSIKIAGYDVSKNLDKARKLIGYCPQPNLIFDTMSVEEHVYYYARIKGIPSSHRKKLVESAIQQLGLQEHRKKAAGTLSGGNQRKLCVAQAIVGNPPIILLDEPSAGMDPEARRFMWSVVAKIAQNKTSAVVLTTHSMEEAEALSTKMGIMVKGGIFKCFGSAQHIKNKFGTGYVIELKLRVVPENELWSLVQQHFQADGKINLTQSTPFDSRIIQVITEKIQDQVNTELFRQVHTQICFHNCIQVLCGIFNQVELLEQYGDYIRLRVARLDKSIGFVFGLIEQIKEKHNVASYSVSQTTLEQIFQTFADLQFDEKVTTYANIVQCDEDSEDKKQILSIINK